MLNKMKSMISTIVALHREDASSENKNPTKAFWQGNDSHDSHPPAPSALCYTVMKEYSDATC